MQKSELCINIWFIVDIETLLSYNWSIKAYNLLGDDQFKLQLLKHLAESDYTTVERENFPDNLRVVFPDGELKGKIPLSGIQQQLDSNIDYYIQYVERNLPKIISFSGDITNDHKAIEQKVPDNPLFVLTVLMENRYGEIRPYTTKENLEWFNEQRNTTNL